MTEVVSSIVFNFAHKPYHTGNYVFKKSVLIALWSWNVKMDLNEKIESHEIYI